MRMAEFKIPVFLTLSLLILMSGCNFDDDGPLLPDETGEYAYPIPTIISPDNYSTYKASDDITFTGSAIAGDSTAIPGSSLSWRSTRDGELGTGSSLTTNLSVGNHFIILTASDSNDSTASVSISLYIEDDTPSLTVTILSPSTGSYPLGTSLLLTANATDGTTVLPDSMLVWSSSIDGMIGSGNNIVYVPSTGSHTLTVIATDSIGNTASASVDLTVTTGSTGDEPAVVITSPENGDEFIPGDTVMFTGLAVDFEDNIIVDTMLVWTSDVDGVLGRGYSLNAVLSSATHRITLTATDTYGNVGTDMIFIVIGIAEAPTVLIINPREDDSFSETDVIDFHGLTISELPITDYEWWSSFNGVIGREQIIESLLLPGHHTIVFSAMNSAGLWGRDTIHIRVGENNIPVVAIAQPDDSAHFAEGEMITFIGSAYDLDDGPITGTDMFWSSSRDRFLHYGQTFDWPHLSPGEHVITLYAIDTDLNEGSDSIRIFVEGLDGPVPVILTPLPYAQFPELELITFGGYAIDDEDGTLPPDQLKWYSSIDGYLGNTAPLMRALTPGEHLITLVAQDSDSMTGVDSVRITVLNYPDPMILTPANGSRFRDDEWIICRGIATDVEDGDLPATSLTWSIDDADAGSGDSISVMLEAGVHRIDLTAIDSDGLETEVTVHIRVDASTIPYIMITSPEDGYSVSEGVSIVFSCIATDVEDGELTGDRVKWYSDGVWIGDGTYFSRGLPEGTHRITATATDSDLLSASDSVTVVID